MTTKLQTHENAPWLGSFPSGWIFRRGKFFFRNRKEINSDLDCDNVLSLTMGGVIHREELGEGGLLPASYETFQVFYPNNLVFKLIDLENYKTSRVGLVPEKGIMSSAYIRLVPIDESAIYPKFAYYFYYNLYLQGIYNFLGMGVRSTLAPWNLLEIPILLPPLETQKQIAGFLDEKTKVIDELIAKKEKLIEFLREKRAALITRAVTKGIDPNAKLKSSGIDWLGDIPEGWEICRIRFLVQANPSKSEISDFPNQPVSFLPMSYVSENGVLDLSEERDLNFIYTGYTYFRDGDVILAKITPCFENGKGAFISSLKNGVGFGSTEFHVFRPKKIDGKFLYYFFASDGFMKFGELNMKGTAGQKRVPELFIKDFVMGVPKAKEQKRIADFLDAETGRIDKAVMLIESQIDELKEYRSSLIYHAVTGKIKI